MPYDVPSLLRFQEDVLILAGDVANTMEVLQETLLLLKQRFNRLFFCPGNHDVWMQGWKNGNSLDKLRAIMDFCKSAGIEVEPGVVNTGALGKPEDLHIADGSVAKELDRLNDQGFAAAMKRRDDAVGSLYLQQRVDAWFIGLQMSGYDMDVDGVRYLQAALGTPAERTWAGSIASLGDFPSEKRPCLIWHHGWAPRHRSSWTKYYQRYGRQPQVTHLVPSVCCNLYTPSATCRSGWIAGRMPIWLFGTLPSRLQEAQMVIREVQEVTGFDVRSKNAKALEKLPKSSQGEPRLVEATEAIGWHKKASHTFIDVRMGGRDRIPGSIALPHPDATETLVSLEDDDLLQLCEQMNAKGGQMVIIAHELKYAWDAAMLLAGYFRMWPSEMTIIRGGWTAWQDANGPLE
eukprot:symbB.v1.2.011007.t1/scaffold687.1/size172701/13